jgi:hypothetical protein
MTMTILEDAARRVHTYSERCVHYDFIAEGVYAARRRLEDPFSLEYQPYIITGLIGFDIRGRWGTTIHMQPPKGSAFICWIV